MKEPHEVALAMRAAETGNAGHWPTVAAALRDEVTRLRQHVKVWEGLATQYLEDREQQTAKWIEAAAERDAAESSRRDWAAEAMRLDTLHKMRRRQLAEALNQPRDRSWNDLLDEANRLAEAWLDGIAAELAAERQKDAPPITVCACVSDDQADQLNAAGFSRPVCAVHPTWQAQS